jgi:hypothetical protein
MARLHARAQLDPRILARGDAIVFGTTPPA